jgi:D-alanyl-D-alanine dipeptidase
LPYEIIQRRITLRESMKAHGFSGIRTEWWHFSYKREVAELSKWEWWCE